MADFHADVAHLSWLIGSWEGNGRIAYPTMESEVQFRQELTISHDGRPFLLHHSRTWEVDAAGNEVRPRAMEVGFWRPGPDNEAELLLSHPTGFLEMWNGTVVVTGLVDARITGARITLATDAIVRSQNAKDVAAGQRMYGLVEDGDLAWVYDMAAMGHGMTSHIWAKLRRTGD